MSSSNRQVEGQISPKNCYTQHFSSQLYKETLELEKQILLMNNLEPNKDILIFNVQITINNEIHQIHTSLKKPQNINQSKGDIIFIHGYGGSNLMSIDIIKELSTDYNCWCIDVIGMGCSSRPEIETSKAVDKKQEQAQFFKDYFVQMLELWRQQVNLKSFYLCGHSLGGYIVSSYAIAFPQYIRGLYLLSPAGLAKANQEEDMQDLEQKLKSQNKGTIKRKLMFKVAKYVVSNEITPIGLFKKISFIGKHLLKGYLKNYWKLPEVQVKLWQQYLVNLFKMPISTQVCLHNLLQFPGLKGRIQLEDELKSDKFNCIPIRFFYGSIDFNPLDVAKRIAEANQVKNSLHIISEAGHQITIHNPLEFSQKFHQILKDDQNLIQKLRQKNDEMNVSDEEEQFKSYQKDINFFENQNQKYQQQYQ